MLPFSRLPRSTRFTRYTVVRPSVAAAKDRHQAARLYFRERRQYCRCCYSQLRTRTTRTVLHLDRRRSWNRRQGCDRCHRYSRRCTAGRVRALEREDIARRADSLDQCPRRRQSGQPKGYLMKMSNDSELPAAGLFRCTPPRRWPVEAEGRCSIAASLLARGLCRMAASRTLILGAEPASVAPDPVAFQTLVRCGSGLCAGRTLWGSHSRTLSRRSLGLENRGGRTQP